MYKYDDNGNRTYYAHDFGYETLCYEQFDRLKTRDMRDYQISYSYDGRGNQTQKKTPQKTTNYNFDLNDRLISIYENGQKVSEYGYDYRGMRVKTECSPISPAGSFPTDAGKPNTSYYWYGNGSEVLADTNASGNVTALYIMAGKQKVAVIKPSLSSNSFPASGQGAQPERISYFHCDVLGSVVAITDEVGLIKEANVYGPFGEAEFSYKGKFYKDYGFDNRYGYTGQEQDTPGGLMYYNARWYDSEVGRFISEDPASAEPENPLSVNRYIYCLNNPLIYTDPTGLKPNGWAVALGIVATIVTGGLAGAAILGALGGAAAAGMVGVAVAGVVGAAVGTYVGTFTTACISGERFENATHAASMATVNQNYGLVIVGSVVCYQLFGGNSKTADGQDILENTRKLKQRGVGLDGLNLNTNGLGTSDYLARYEFINPTTGGSINSAFGMRKHPIFKTYKLHEGIDVINSGEYANAVADGVVTYAGPRGGYGFTVIVNHGGGVTSMYAHGSTILDNAMPGMTVSRGQSIMEIGSTGLSTGKHLHFEIRLRNIHIDPQKVPGIQY